MAVETVTTITCDECGRDITTDVAYYIGASQQIVIGPDAPRASLAIEPTPSQLTESLNRVLCDDHGAAVWAQVTAAALAAKAGKRKGGR